MVLPSQTGRSGGPRRGMVSGRRRRQRWRIILVLAAAAVAAYFYWGGDKAETDDTQTPPAASGQAANHTPKPRPVQRHVAPTPITRVTPKPARQPLPAPTPVRTAPPEPKPSTAPPPPKPTPNTVTAPPTTPAPPATPPATPINVSGPLAEGFSLIEQGRLIEGRRVLSSVLTRSGTGLSARNAQAIRDNLSIINQTLIFSPKIDPADPLTAAYRIQSGDLLLRIAPRYHVTYQLLELINRVNARRIRAGQTLKVVNGPFHAVVDKSDYRMDVFLGSPDGSMVYVRSFVIGLGEDDSTPLGSWVVRRGGKMANPSWTNPRTGKFYQPDDPTNPVGDYWIGLKGTDEQTKGLSGYGIHGTIEPETIGRSASMGCVRMHSDDIELTYKLLVGGHSTVTIVP